MSIDFCLDSRSKVHTYFIKKFKVALVLFIYKFYASSFDLSNNVFSICKIYYSRRGQG